MGERLRSWWQRVRKPLEIAVLIVGCVLVLALLVVIALAYIFNVNVPGLRGKTLWDWLQLLIIPVVLAIGGYLFNLAVSRNEQRNTTDNQRETALQGYIDKMSELLLDKDNPLRESKPEDEVRMIARVRTLTILPRLDANRKRSVLQFLYESRLITLSGVDEFPSNWRHIDPGQPIIPYFGLPSNWRNKARGQPIIDLSGADLTRADLAGADLSGADLSKANLREANLSFAELFLAQLEEADLGEANLSFAYPYGANLSRAKLQGANLSFAFLSGANLNVADLSGANLFRAKLSGATSGEDALFGANLTEADLSKANLHEADLGTAPFGADLSGADLSEANLKGARGMTVEELKKQAKSLKGATMPDGSIIP